MDTAAEVIWSETGLLRLGTVSLSGGDPAGMVHKSTPGGRDPMLKVEGQDLRVGQGRVSKQVGCN